MFDEKKYTEDSIIKQLTLIQLHSTDGSALDAGCSCIEGKHLHALEGLAEEGTMTASNPQEKAFYENLAEVARATRKAIEEQNWNYYDSLKKRLCKIGYALHEIIVTRDPKLKSPAETDLDLQKGIMDVHLHPILKQHPKLEKTVLKHEMTEGKCVFKSATQCHEKAVKGEAKGIRKKVEKLFGDNPGGRAYEPHGLTECEKTHPRILRKISRCIRKVEKREGCKPPYTDCAVNPVAICRASVKCP